LKGVSVQDRKAIGVICDRGASVGVLQQHLVEIDPREVENVVIAINATPFSLRVTNLDPFASDEVTTATTNHEPQTSEASHEQAQNNTNAGSTLASHAGADRRVSDRRP